MTPSIDSIFKSDYQTHLQHLRLKGLQPKTIEAYARAIRRIGGYFDNYQDIYGRSRYVKQYPPLIP